MSWSKKINYLLWGLLIVLLAFGQFERIEWLSNAPFYLHDLLILAWLIGLLLTFKLSFQKIWKNYGWELLLVVWILLGWLMAALAGNLSLRAFLYTARFGVYLFWWVLLRQGKYLNSVVYKIGFVVMGLLVGWWGVLQYLFLPDVRFLKILGWDDHYYRLVSTQFDPQFAGLILVMTLLFWERIKISKKWLKWLVQVALTVAIGMTFSRSTFLSLGLAVGLVLIWGKSKFKFDRTTIWRWLSLPLILVITLLFLPKPGGEGVNLARTASIEARSEASYVRLANLEGSEWIWGGGLFNSQQLGLSQENGFERSYHAVLADNILVFAIQSLGVVGFLLLVGLVVKWSKKWWQDRPWFLLTLLVVLVHAFFNNSLFQPFIFLMLLGAW